MAELKGTFYGVSVGPGDPELLTLQAVRLIRKCPVLAAPQTSSGQMLALDIARSALGEALDGKTIIPLHFAMSRDPAVLAASHKEAVQAVRPYLDAGQDTAMLNLGDVSIYATFGYLQCLLEAEGYPTAMAAGVPSFCAAAAQLNVPLTGGIVALLYRKGIQTGHKSIQQNHLRAHGEHFLQDLVAVLFHNGHVHALLLQRFAAGGSERGTSIRHQKSHFVHGCFLQCVQFP